ncbi:MAG: hypothetical protein GY869_32065 [Planctomycetes bacterium]|nr:hypothetical protein [Planctomycetota bacterium]
MMDTLGTYDNQSLIQSGGNSHQRRNHPAPSPTTTAPRSATRRRPSVRGWAWRKAWVSRVRRKMAESINVVKVIWG